MIVSVVMMVLNNNLVTAFGLMAVFAVVRFRNVLRDTLDTSYVLTVLAVGMGCGTQRFSMAVIATVALILVMFYLWYTSYGMRHRYDVIVNLHWARPLVDLAWMTRVLERHARTCIAPRNVPARPPPARIFPTACCCAIPTAWMNSSRNCAPWKAFPVSPP